MAKITVEEIIENTTGNVHSFYEIMNNYGNMDYFIANINGKNMVKDDVEETLDMWKNIAMALGCSLSLDYIKKNNLKDMIADAADKWIEKNLMGGKDND